MKEIHKLDFYECFCIDDSLPVGETSETLDMSTWIKKNNTYIGTPQSRLDQIDGNIPYLQLLDIEPQSLIRSYPGFNPRRFAITKIQQITIMDEEKKELSLYELYQN